MTYGCLWHAVKAAGILLLTTACCSSASSTTSSDAPSSTASASDSSTGTADKATSNAVVNIKGPSNDSSKSSSSSKSSEPSKASSSSSSAASSTKSPSSTSSASSGDYTGIATWYTQNGNAGACGKYNPDSAKIIALYTSVYGDGSKCGKTVRITNLDDGGSVDAVVAGEWLRSKWESEAGLTRATLVHACIHSGLVSQNKITHNH